MFVVNTHRGIPLVVGTVFLAVVATSSPGIASQPWSGAGSPCVIGSITDGDTFRCSDGTRVRLLLIDTPERNQSPYGAQATRALQSLIQIGEKVRLEADVEPLDRYGRTLAYVYLPDGRMVNEEMARLGFAVALVYPPNVRHVDRIRAAVADARDRKVGLWSGSAFDCAPVDHRRGRC